METAKGNKTQKGVWGGIFLYSSYLCRARHILLFPLQPVGSAAAPTLPDPRTAGKQQHRGVNTSGRLKHHLLKDLPCLLMAWALRQLYFFISVLSSPGAANALHANKAGESRSFSALIRDVYSILCHTQHFRVSLRDCTLRTWADQTHQMHNALDSHIINYVPLNPNHSANNFLTELKIPTKGRSPLMPEHSSVGIRDTV